MRRVPGALAALLALPCAGAACAAGGGRGEASCDMRGNMLLQAGSKVSLKDLAAANVDEGLTVHLFNSKEAQENPHSVVVRPLFKKTFMCETSNPSSCKECYGGPGCFNLRQNYNGLEYVDVAADPRKKPPWRHHRLRVNFYCPEGLKVAIKVRVALKGWLSKVNMKALQPSEELEPEEDRPEELKPLLQVGHKPAQRDMMQRVREGPRGGGRRMGRRMVTLTKTWSSMAGGFVELDLHFMLHRKGWAKVRDIRIQTTSEYLACQDHQTCLKVLGESGEGLSLRSNNFLQLSCLEGGLIGNDACSSWKTCLDSVGNTKRMLKLLLAAGVNGSDKAEREEEGRKKPEDDDLDVRPTPVEEDSCTDPRIEDPASWLCSCLERMEETCLAVSNYFSPGNWSSQHCLTAQMCLDPFRQICSDWKVDVGCGSPAYAELKNRLLEYFAVTGPASSPAPELPMPPATELPAALLARSQGARRSARGGAVLDSTVRGKVSPTAGCR